MTAILVKGGGAFRGIKLLLCENPLPPLLQTSDMVADGGFEIFEQALVLLLPFGDVLAPTAATSAAALRFDFVPDSAAAGVVRAVA